MPRAANEPFRQNSVVEYMVEKNPLSPYTTREVATALGVTTNAILRAFKRLRTNGRVFQGNSKEWYLTTSERQKHQAFAERLQP